MTSRYGKNLSSAPRLPRSCRHAQNNCAWAIYGWRMRKSKARAGRNDASVGRPCSALEVIELQASRNWDPIPTTHVAVFHETSCSVTYTLYILMSCAKCRLLSILPLPCRRNLVTFETSKQRLLPTNLDHPRKLRLPITHLHSLVYLLTNHQLPIPTTNCPIWRHRSTTTSAYATAGGPQVGW